MVFQRLVRGRFALPVVAVFLFLGQVVTAYASSQIGAISIQGLERTRERTVMDIIPVAVGDSITDETLEDTRNDLLDSGIFAEVSVTIEPIPDAPGQSELVIVIDERWTLVPVPFFSTDGNAASGGLILIESNLFGRNKQLISAGTVGTDGFSGFLVFVDPAVAGSRWRLSTSVSTGRGETEAQLTDGDRVRRYEADGNSGRVGIGYGFASDLAIGLSLGVVSSRIVDFDPGIDESQPEDADYLEPALEIEYDLTTPMDVLRRGPEIASSARYVSLEDGWELTARGVYNLGIAGYQRLRFLAAAGWGEMPVLAETDISSRDGFRTVPYQATRADRWGSGAIAYDLPVLRGDWGALVLSHYWEGGSWDADSHNQQFFYGPGAAFRVYIRQVAIPAVGIDYAYNLESSDFVFSLTVGARM